MARIEKDNRYGTDVELKATFIDVSKHTFLPQPQIRADQTLTRYPIQRRKRYIGGTAAPLGKPVSREINGNPKVQPNLRSKSKPTIGSSIVFGIR
jgi:hypothetical protein